MLINYKKTNEPNVFITETKLNKTRTERTLAGRLKEK